MDQAAFLPPDFRKRVKRELLELDATLVDLATASAIPYARLAHILGGFRQARPFEIEALGRGFVRLRAHRE